MFIVLPIFALLSRIPFYPQSERYLWRLWANRRKLGGIQICQQKIFLKAWLRPGGVSAINYKVMALKEGVGGQLHLVH